MQIPSLNLTAADAMRKYIQYCTTKYASTAQCSHLPLCIVEFVGRRGATNNSVVDVIFMTLGESRSFVYGLIVSLASVMCEVQK